MPLPKLLALIMIVTTMLSAGLQLNWPDMLAALKNYGLQARAMLANFVLVPLAATVLVRAFHVDSPVATGILLMAMAPGVPFLVNSAARTQGGSLAFALEFAFLFSTLSVITIPVTAALVLPPHALEKMPAAQFLTTLLLFQLLPLIAGALLSWRLKPEIAGQIGKLLHIAFLAAALALTVVIFPKLVVSVSSTYGFGHLLIIAVMGIFSVLCGWLLGGPGRDYRRTLSIATLMRNIGFCSLIGTSAFAGTGVVPTVIAYSLITFALSLPIRIYYKRTAQRRGAMSA